MDGDGACFFSAVIITAGLELHPLELRDQVCDYLDENKEYFIDLFAHSSEAYDLHVQRMRDPSTWATEFEVMATSHLLLRPIHAITDAAEDHGCVMQFAPLEHISQDAWDGTLYLAHFLDWHFEGTAQDEPEIASQ